MRAVVARAGSSPQINGATDYYPFGMPMPGRSIVGGYRYAYQGQEKDPETGKEAFELRLWDSRIGRWLTTDPAGQFFSPYLGMGNNPVSVIDPDGGFACVDADGNSFPCPENFEQFNGPTVVDAHFDENLNLSFFSSGNFAVGANLIPQESLTELRAVNDFIEQKFQNIVLPDIPGSEIGVALIGASLASAQYSFYNPKGGFWTGINLKTYSFNFNGNGSVGGKYSFGRAASRLLTGFGYSLGVYNMYSIHSDLGNDPLSFQYIAEQSSNIYSTLGGLQGAAWSIGWELGRATTKLPGYENNFRQPVRNWLGLPRDLPLRN